MKRHHRLLSIAASAFLMLLLASIPTVAQLSNTAKLALDGIGPIRVGMTITEAERATGIKLIEPSQFRATDSCYHVYPATGSPKIAFMIFSGSAR
jgi:hypothetical protein